MTVETERVEAPTGDPVMVGNLELIRRHEMRASRSLARIVLAERSARLSSLAA